MLGQSSGTEDWGRSMKRTDLREAVAEAWRAFDRAESLACRVRPSAPVLFFGDFDAYSRSPLRVVTVGLNPSLREFPGFDPFLRFPLAAGIAGRRLDRYLNALGGYFRECPYWAWFSTIEPLLNGMDASYHLENTSAALHTDLCSPVATDPTWSRLDGRDRRILQADGVTLWHSLLNVLRPQVVLLSIAQRHLTRIRFRPRDREWQSIHEFDRTGSGVRRSPPYPVQARWFDIVDEPALFVFGRAAQKPFGLLADTQKREAGTIAGEVYRNGG